MPVLTSAAADPSRPGYRLLYIDKGRFASLADADLIPLALVVGTELAGSVLDRLQILADVEAAYRAALRAQARRPHARRDLRRRLIQKQHPPAAVDAALGRLDERGLLDDRRFAEHFAATRAARGRGPARLVTDLLRQGVDRRVAEESVQASLAAEDLDPERLVRRVATRRAGQLSGLPVAVRRRRLILYLARRGYDGSWVRQVVDEVVGSSDYIPSS